MNITEIKRDIEQLPVQERATLGQWIITNLDETEDNNETDIAWHKEVRKRLDEIKKE